MATEINKRLFNVDEYQRMAEAGILSNKDRVELIRGEILAMSPIGPPHNGAVLRATNALVPIVGHRAIVGIQGAIRLDDYDEPQPDVYLLRPRDDFYTTGHAGPPDIFLIIEIADSSLDFDRTVKAALYAETAVTEYWIADIVNDCVWVHLRPEGNSYQVVRRHARGETVVPSLLPDCPIPLAVLLP